MDEREAFFAAITARPDEDTPRLAFADWLTEHDEPRRARFIREQMRGAAYHGPGLVLPVRGRGARTGFSELLSRKPWVRDDVLGTDAGPPGYVQFTNRWSAVVWRRGFIEGVLCSGSLLVRALPMLRQHPVREVLLTCPPARAWVRSVDAGVGTVFTRNADNDPRLVRLLQRPFPGLVRAVLTDRRLNRTDVFFRTVG